MPPSRRGITKSSLPKLSPPIDDRNGTDENGFSSMYPKHINIPDIPVDGELKFELELFFLGFLAMFSQYLNLYKSVWWLPHSYRDNAGNFYLLDYHIVAVGFIMISRNMPHMILKKISMSFLPYSVQHWCFNAINILNCTVFGTILVWLAYHIIQDHGILHIVPLLYPGLVYCVLFSQSWWPFFEKCPFDQKLKNVTHVCYNSPESIREDVEFLKADFNHRLKGALYSALVLAYYSTFLPSCFVTPHLYYDHHWMYQQVVLVFATSMLMTLLQYFPVQYCDVLHRAALHLGRWYRIEHRNNLHIPYNIWSESHIWHQGSLVKYMKETFRAEWVTNAAEPGNAGQSRFYASFHNLNLLLGLQLALQLILLLFEMCLLCVCIEWQKLMSLLALLPFSFHTLYKMFRNYLVLSQIYDYEKMTNNPENH